MGILKSFFNYSFYFVFTGYLFTSCVVTKEKALTYKDTFSLNADIIRTDGYYYMSDSTDGRISMFIFFSNGYLYQGNYLSHEQIKEWVYQGNGIKGKYNWGVYRIDDNAIKVQHFTAPRSNELRGIWDVIEITGVIANKDSLVFEKSILLGKQRNFRHSYSFSQMDIKLNSMNWLMDIKKQSEY